MRVYHFTSAEHGLEDVRLRRLKIATLSDINDPFELAVCCGDQVQRQALRATRLVWAKKSGMLCFSSDWSNPVQWSHYAEKHRGICLGFDVQDELVTQVKYSKAPLQLNWAAIELGGTVGEAEMTRWLSTKFIHWRYENEWRAFPSLDQSDANGRYFCEFGNELVLREILVGSESLISRHDVQQALDQLSGIVCIKTRLAFGDYRIVKQLDSSMWR